MARGDGRPPGSAVVVGFDGRLEAVRTLRFAAEIAARAGGDLHVVHAVTLADYGIDPDNDDFEAERDRHLEQYRRLVADALGPAGVSWSYHEPVGDPARRLAEVADAVDAWAIVVAAEHGGWIHHMVSGHVVTRLIRGQHRPVIVLPHARDTTRRLGGEHGAES